MYELILEEGKVCEFLGLYHQLFIIFIIAVVDYR